MARNTIVIDAPPSTVFEVLADARSYSHWVVGSRCVRAADTAWPAAGATLHHTVGVPPFTLDDATSVIASEPDRRLQLRARARPLPTARVTIDLEPADRAATRVLLTEEPMRRRLSKLMGPLGHLLIWLRNIVSLRRLKALSEGTTARPGGDLPAPNAGEAR